MTLPHHRQRARARLRILQDKCVNGVKPVCKRQRGLRRKRIVSAQEFFSALSVLSTLSAGRDLTPSFLLGAASGSAALVTAT